MGLVATRMFAFGIASYSWLANIFACSSSATFAVVVGWAWAIYVVGVFLLQHASAEIIHEPANVEKRAPAPGKSIGARGRRFFKTSMY